MKGPAMLYLTKRVHFSASHRLCQVELSPEKNRSLYGPCYNVHGHNYLLEVTVRGEPDPRTGWILDLGDLKGLLEEKILHDVDHRDLNDDVAWLRGINPTAENLAVVFWKRIEDSLEGARLHRVRVYESENNYAEFLGEGEAHEPA